VVGGGLVGGGGLCCKAVDEEESGPASNPLQKSSVQRQARIESSPSSTFFGWHSGTGATGSLMLPNKISLEKHSRITALGSPGERK